MGNKGFPETLGADAPGVVYFRAEGRGGAPVERILDGFPGTLQVDGALTAPMRRTCLRVSDRLWVSENNVGNSQCSANLERTSNPVDRRSVKFPDG